MSTFAPPLPDLGALLSASPWAAAEPGLVDAASGWRQTLPVARRELEEEAAALARPRLWIDTVGSLATTGFKVVAAGAPDAPVALLSIGRTTWMYRWDAGVHSAPLDSRTQSPIRTSSIGRSALSVLCRTLKEGQTFK